MSKTKYETVMRSRRQRRIRKRIHGTADRPRLRVTRSLKHIYAQLIDDDQGVTLCSASSVALKVAGGNLAGAEAVGKALGELAKEKNIDAVSFDRGGNLYHGRVKALAEAARDAGLQF